MKAFLLICFLVASFGIIAILNVPVTTQQGINYQLHTIKLPLYLKLFNFLDRHFNYSELVENILNGVQATEQEKALAIFTWTYNNIKKRPDALPVVDDHVWYTIIRGYGVSDQFSDVFTTLCNYANISAFFTWIYSSDKKDRIPISFVRIGQRWCLFDPYNGIYFVNLEEKIASTEELNVGKWKPICISELPREYVDYNRYFSNLSLTKDYYLSRARIQSPLRRVIYQIRKVIFLNDR